MPFTEREDTTFNTDANGKILSVKAKGTGAVKCRWARGQYQGQEFLPDGHADLVAADTKNSRKSEILTRLNQIDLESVRPLRAVNEGSAVTADTDKLTVLETEAGNLRTELAGL